MVTEYKAQVVEAKPATIYQVDTTTFDPKQQHHDNVRFLKAAVLRSCYKYCLE